MANKAYALRRSASAVVALTLAGGIAAWVLYAGTGLNRASQVTLQKSNSRFRLVSGETQLRKDGPTAPGVLEHGSSQFHTAMLQQSSGAGSAPASSEGARVTTWIEDRAPVRVLKDPYSGFVAVAVDSLRDEIVAQDVNLSRIMVYNRLDNTPPTATMTEPKRIIGGNQTKVKNNCGVYIDPQNGDIYSVTDDSTDLLTIFSREHRGNTPATRALETPHHTFGIAVDEDANELFLSIQHPPAVVVYRKTAEADEAPLRILEGNHTQLADVYGMVLDTKNQLMFVANRGAGSSMIEGTGWLSIPTRIVDGKRTWELSGPGGGPSMVPGSGKFALPSITVYPIKASGDTPPLRTIQGPRTQLNWPSQMYMDTEHGELFVADTMEDAILVFRATDSGNVAPFRVLQGPKTWLKQPQGVFIDEKNDEMVVANYGNHSTTVYPRTAAGDTAPIRTIRSAPEGTPSPMLGGVGAVAYDSKRDELLAPN